ncbi:universal stress protein [Catellatospora coxensis]|uniref:Universal stress protein n=1 Tax=Catellatospora coxensis TaxID=310354 RepID=A0A8J3PC06_9ACTN|nr:universal stress protein [Catellatospora coxensis]GIG11492.1 universal stress protein [Catellatospora coxensis]
MNTAPIVVGVDGSPSADLALGWAADEARLRHVPLKLVYVVDSPGPRGAYGYLTDEVTCFGEDLLARAKELIADRQVPATAAIVCDDAAHGLIREAAGATMLVVGSRGHGGFHDLLLGSTSLQTAMHAPCPVAVVRPRGDGAPGQVVLGTDGSPRSAAAARVAFEQARLRRTGVTVVHAWRGSLSEATAGLTELDACEVKAWMVLNDALAPWLSRYPDVPVRKVLRKDSAARALVDESAGAELVVVGRRGRGGFASLVLGSAGHALLHHAACPVVVVSG